MKLLKCKNGNKQVSSGVYDSLDKKEIAVIIVTGLIIQFIIAYTFYQSFIAFVLLSPITYYYYKIKKVEKIESKKRVIELQFKEMLLSISASLSAGYAIENACKEALDEMNLLFGTNSIIYKELNYIIKQLSNNRPIEKLFVNLSDRTRINEIKEFADILVIAKKQGGNLPTIIQNTSSLISGKIEMNREIRMIISGKKMEQSVMNIMPIAIIFYIQFTTPGFFDPLYHNLVGIIIMTTCMLVYALAYVLAQKILKIAL